MVVLFWLFLCLSIANISALCLWKKINMNKIYTSKIANFIRENASSCLCIGILTAVLFVIYRIVPPTADLWSGSWGYNHHGGLLRYMKGVRDGYEVSNGRIASNFINGIVESFPSQMVLDLFNAAVNILVYVGIWNLCNEKGRFCRGAVFYLALVLMMSPQMRNEVLFCANSAYVVPVLLIPVYFVLLDRLEKDVDHATRITAWMCLVCFAVCTWMEHIAVGFGTLLSVVLCFLLKTRNRLRYYVLCTWIVSAASGVLMMLSPGLRAHRTFVVIGSTIDVIKQNIRFTEEYIIGQNIPVVLCFLLVMLIFMLVNDQVNRGIKIFYVVFIGMGIIWCVLAGIYRLWGVEEFQIFYDYLQFASYPQSLAVSVGVLFVVFAIVCGAFVFSRNRKLLFGILILCCFSLLPILPTPNQAPRIVNIGFWGIVCCTIVLFVEIRISGRTAQRAFSMLSMIIIILSLDQTILLTRRIHEVQKRREEIIEEVRMRQALGEWDYDDNVIMPLFKGNDMLQYERQAGEYHYTLFLDYYGLKEDTKVVFEDCQ